MAVAISSALRLPVPLNNRCSRKCEEPATASVSSREPTLTQMPTVADNTPGIVSVSTRRPPGSSVRSTRPPTSSTSRTTVSPTPAGAGTDAVAPVPAPVRARVRSVVTCPPGWRSADTCPVVPCPRTTSRARSCLRGRGVAGRGGLGSAVPIGRDGHEADLAAGVDVGDLDLQLVTDVDDVLDLADALAAAQLADVHQAVLAREQGDEGAERRGLDDRAEEALADLGHLRVGDGVDPVHRRLRRGAVGGADVDRAVVLDGDVRAGLVLDGVDHLALGADDRADLVDRDLDGGDARRVVRHVRRGA